MRRDTPRRITPERMEFYRQRAKQLRDDAYRDMWRAVWAMLKNVIGSSFRGDAKREPGIHNHDREYGFRARATRAPE